MNASNHKEPAGLRQKIDLQLQHMEAQLCQELADLDRTHARLTHVLECLARHPRFAPGSSSMPDAGSNPGRP